MRELKLKIEEYKIQYPSLSEDFEGLWDLYVMEIEQGSSKEHEIHLAYTDIEQLIEEYNENRINN